MAESGKQLDEATVRELIHLYIEKKWPVNRVARHLHVASSTVRHHLVVNEIPRRGRQGQPRTVIPADEEGVIVTIKEQKTGTLHTLHEYGTHLDALAYIGEKIDRMPGDWKLVCYSTPGTIFGDLRPGARVRPRGFLEAHALARIGRLDLLDPDLRNGHPKKP